MGKIIAAAEAALEIADGFEGVRIRLEISLEGELLEGNDWDIDELSQADLRSEAAASMRSECDALSREIYGFPGCISWTYKAWEV